MLSMRRQGLFIKRDLSLNTTGVNVTAKGTYLVGWQLHNVAITARFVKLYDLAVAPIVGTSTPVITVALAAGATDEVAFGTDAPFFVNGFGYGASNLVADTDTTNTTANDVTANFFYYTIP